MTDNIEEETIVVSIDIEFTKSDYEVIETLAKQGGLEPQDLIRAILETVLREAQRG